MSKDLRNLGIVLGGVIVICFIIYKVLMNTTLEPASINQNNLLTTNIPMVGNLAASHSFSYGPLDSKVTVVEFFDPECESCAAVAPILKNEMKYYEGKVRWVFRYMAYHSNSKTAIKVIEASRKQNLFLEAKDLLFENQKDWGEKQTSTEDEILRIVSQIKQINMSQLKKDMNDPQILDTINQDEAEGKQAGVKGTPTFFVNGVLIEQMDMDLLIQKINERLQ